MEMLPEVLLSILLTTRTTTVFAIILTTLIGKGIGTILAYNLPGQLLESLRSTEEVFADESCEKNCSFLTKSGVDSVFFVMVGVDAGR